jgi:hypothetical protein
MGRKAYTGLRLEKTVGAALAAPFAFIASCFSSPEKPATSAAPANASLYRRPPNPGTRPISRNSLHFEGVTP